MYPLNRMSEHFMETTEFDLVSDQAIPVIIVHLKEVFDRPQYAHFIQEAGDTLANQPHAWLFVIRHGVYKVRSNHEIMHVLSYIYGALVRDPLGKNPILKIPVAPAQPPIIPTTIKFSIINKD